VPMPLDAPVTSAVRPARICDTSAFYGP
jgi:hypothetical protein